MTASETLQKANSVSGSASISNIIGRTLIVEWGTVKEVLGDGSVVEVLLSVTDKPENATIVTCTLISPCSKNVSVNVMPSVGDKVLVLSPRFFDQDMFDVADDTEVIIQKNSRGYNKLSCLAILFNQFREDTHKNYINISEGTLDIKLAYSEDDDKNFLNISTTPDGDIALSNDKADISLDKDGALAFSNENCTITTDKDGYLSYANTNDNSTKLEFTSTGSTIQDKNGCKIVTDSQFTTINGKLKIKI